MIVVGDASDLQSVVELRESDNESWSDDSDSGAEEEKEDYQKKTRHTTDAVNNYCGQSFPQFEASSLLISANYFVIFANLTFNCSS